MWIPVTTLSLCLRLFHRIKLLSGTTNQFSSSKSLDLCHHLALISRALCITHKSDRSGACLPSCLLSPGTDDHINTFATADTV